MTRTVVKLTVQQVAEQVGVTPSTVRMWIKLGLLPAQRVGPRLLRIDPDDLDEFMSASA